jgi:MFS family permease
VIVLFAITLGLNGADLATVGAVAPQLEHAMHIGNTKIGLLSSVALLTGAVITIPVGLLVDRIPRMPLLYVSVVLWSIASLLSAFAPDYSTLLLTRFLMGAVVATAGPAIASMTGDYFPAKERGQVWAYILGGELAGNAVGFIVSGSLASLISWRAAFVVLALPGVALAWSLYHNVPEPRRTAQTQADPAADGDDLARATAERLGIKADEKRVLRRDPRTLDLAAAVRYVVTVPTNLMMIVSSSLGYFYFAGLQTFALLFVRGRYHANQATAELVLALLVVGAMIGTLIAGRLTDVLLRRGMMSVRVWFPAVCYLAAALVLIPGLLGSSLTPAIWFDAIGAGLLCAANPPLDAARLDIMPAGLWGRAESARTVARSLAEAIAPLLFGGLSSLIAGIAPEQTPIGTHAGPVSASTARGLEISFLLLLATVAAAGISMLRARSQYPQDVATAAASDQANRRRAYHPSVPATPGST